MVSIQAFNMPFFSSSRGIGKWIVDTKIEYFLKNLKLLPCEITAYSTTMIFAVKK